jgi:hypothetical protein
MIEVIFKIFLTDYIDFQGFITKRVQKPFLIEYKIICDSIVFTNKLLILADKWGLTGKKLVFVSNPASVKTLIL